MATTLYKSPKLNFGGTGSSTLVGGSYAKGLLGGGSTGGNTAYSPAPQPLPDFGQILASDPFYQAALANLNAQGISDKASRDAALRQAYIRFGDAGTNVDLSFLPADLRAEVSGIISPDVRNLAKQNDTAGLSILARLKDAAQQTAKRTTDVLGSRGLFRSGETGYQFGRNQLYSSQAQYDATNKFLDYIMGVQAAYIQAERQRQALLLQQQQDATNRYTPPPPPPTQQQQHNQAVIDHPYGPGIEPDGSSFPPPPQPTGPITPQEQQNMTDAALESIFNYLKPKPLGSKNAQPQ